MRDRLLLPELITTGPVELEKDEVEPSVSRAA